MKKMKCETYRSAPRWEECVRNLAHWPPILMRLKPEKPNYYTDSNKKQISFMSPYSTFRYLTRRWFLNPISGFFEHLNSFVIISFWS